MFVFFWQIGEQGGLSFLWYIYFFLQHCVFADCSTGPFAATNLKAGLGLCNQCSSKKCPVTCNPLNLRKTPIMIVWHSRSFRCECRWSEAATREHRHCQHPGAPDKVYGRKMIANFRQTHDSCFFFAQFQQPAGSDWAIPPTFSKTCLVFRCNQLKTFSSLLKIVQARSTIILPPFPTNSTRTSYLNISNSCSPEFQLKTLPSIATVALDQHDVGFRQPCCFIAYVVCTVLL